jgi:BirA family biotin operon repressor/biotin-[acetyl-CoA-carboxylase] ligase
MFTEEEITHFPKGKIIGKEIIFFDSIPSTNDKAFEIAMERENPEGLLVVADKQTRGRGRLGRNWISPAGVNLYFTVIVQPPFSPEEASIISLAAPVAVVTAIRKYTGLPAQIKWPNDILIKDKKAGGILLEMKSMRNRTHLVAVGIGINVNMPVDALPSEIRTLSTSLKTETGAPVNRVALLKEILNELGRSYKFLLTGNKRALINEWIRLNSTIGNTVTIRNQERIISGVADSINDKGELRVRLSSGKIETVRAGDVTIEK